MKLEQTLLIHQVNIACITEHWKSQDELVNYIPDGFALTSSYCRDRGQHGGCAIYVEQGMEYSERPDLKAFNVPGIFECCSSQVVLDNNKYLIICIYRPNTVTLNDGIFFEKFIALLDKCLMYESSLIIAGDFNVDILSSTNDTKTFLGILDSFNLRITVTEPTRITQYTATCLDNIITNIDGITTIIEEHLSDHSGQKFIFETSPSPKRQTKKKIRVYNQENHTKFEQLLEDTDWTVLREYREHEINEMWNSFTNHFHDKFEMAFPLRTVRTVRTRRINDSEEIRSIRKELDILFLLSRHRSEYKSRYKAMKKQYDKALTSQKRIYHESAITTAQNKSKAVWNVIKSIKQYLKRNFPLNI